MTPIISFQALLASVLKKYCLYTVVLYVTTLHAFQSSQALLQRLELHLLEITTIKHYYSHSFHHGSTAIAVIIKYHPFIENFTTTLYATLIRLFYYVIIPNLSTSTSFQCENEYVRECFISSFFSNIEKTNPPTGSHVSINLQNNSMK